MSLSRTISNFAEANNKITSRQRTARIIPDRLPTERELTEMLVNLEHVKRLLEQVKDVQSAIRPKGAQPGTKLLRRHQEHVMDLSDGVMKPQYAITDVMEYREVSRLSQKFHMRLTLNSMAFLKTNAAGAGEVVFLYGEMAWANMRPHAVLVDRLSGNPKMEKQAPDLPACFQA